MVLQDYGAAMPMAEEVAQPVRKSAGWKYGAVAAVCMGSLALVLLIGSAPQGEQTALLQTKLSQHLMSQFSRDSTDSDSDEYGSNTMSLSDDSHHGSSWYGNWGHSGSLDGNSAEKSANKWEAQLQKLQAGEAARRKEEDKSFFSGVEKAFGKKTGKAMMAAFNGKSKTSLSKMKLDEKKLKEQKKALADNTKLPNTKAKAADIKKAVAEAKKKVAAAAPKKESAADAKEHQKAHKEAVKAALQVAKDMATHKDPVAKTARKAAPEDEKKDAKDDKKAEKKKPSLKKVGVIGDASKIQALVHDYKEAHGKKKKELKARVQQLTEQIKDDFNRVTSFGHRAQTKFQREEAQGKKSS